VRDDVGQDDGRDRDDAAAHVGLGRPEVRRLARCFGELEASGTFEVSVLSSTVGEASAVIALDPASPWVDD
jgi:hypothetical protein